MSVLDKIQEHLAEDRKEKVQVDESKTEVLNEKIVKVTDLDFTEPNDPSLKKALKKYKVKLTDLKDGPSGYDTGTISGQEKDVLKFLMAPDGYGLDKEDAKEFMN